MQSNYNWNPRLEIIFIVQGTNMNIMFFKFLLFCYMYFLHCISFYSMQMNTSKVLCKVHTVLNMNASGLELRPENRVRSTEQLSPGRVPLVFPLLVHCCTEKWWNWLFSSHLQYCLSSRLLQSKGLAICRKQHQQTKTLGEAYSFPLMYVVIFLKLRNNSGSSMAQFVSKPISQDWNRAVFMDSIFTKYVLPL